MNYTSHMLAAMEAVECITILVTYSRFRCKNHCQR